MTDIDIALFRLINGAHTDSLDVFFGMVSGLGDGMIVALICTAVMLQRFRTGLVALLAFAGSGLLAQGLKRLVDAPRPAAVLDHVHVLGDVLRAHSFPSGHATSLGVLIALAVYLFGLRDWRCWMAVFFAVAAAYGRIYGGVHFPIDVCAGLGIGAVSMWAVRRWIRALPWAWEESDRAWTAVALLLTGEAAALGLGYRMQPGTAQPLAWIVAIAALLYLIRMWRKHGYKGVL